VAIDLFLKIDGIPGESQDAQHKDEIELESFSWGETQPVPHAATGAGAGAGRVEIHDFHFVARISKASPKLLLACASGQHLRQATLTARKAGATPFEFLVVKLSDLLVTSYDVGGSAHQDAPPVDQVSLHFAKIEVEYRPQKPDGSPDAPVKAGWDVANNRPV
jgi:type VI secretion system secreted protein Hcp